MTRSDIQRLFSHVRWANRRVLDSAGQIGSPEASGTQSPMMRILGHVLAAERVWLLRMKGEDSSAQAIWPELSIPEMEDLEASNRAGYSAFIDALDEEALAAEAIYTNQQGKTYRTGTSDILIHVAMHGAYHRGQIATLTRQAGGDPVNTDFITFVREGTEAGGAGTGVHPPGAAGGAPGARDLG